MKPNTAKEHQCLEWKQTWRDEYLRWICGFANAQGGVLQIGKNDRGEVVGVAHAKALLEEIPNKVRDLLGIVVPVDLHRESGLDWLEIVVEAYPRPMNFCSRICNWWKGRTCAKPPRSCSMTSPSGS